MFTYEPLRILMVIRKLEPKDLVELTGLTRQTIAKLMNDNVVSLDVLVKVSKALEVDIGDIIRLQKETEYKEREGNHHQD